MEQIRELMSQLKLYLRLDMAFCDKFEEMEKRLYAVEQDNKRALATIRSLETRYSELMMIVKSIRKDNNL